LSATERQAVISWLKNQQEWSVEHLHEYIETTYGIVFQSRQSYYQLLKEAEITYKRVQRTNPKRDEQRVAAKKKRLLIFWRHMPLRLRVARLWCCKSINVICSGMMRVAMPGDQAHSGLKSR